MKITQEIEISDTIILDILEEVCRLDSYEQKCWNIKLRDIIREKHLVEDNIFIEILKLLNEKNYISISSDPVYLIFPTTKALEIVRLYRDYKKCYDFFFCSEFKPKFQ